MQPVWRFVANLGDANPFVYGGYFLFEDQTGAYPAEVEVVDPDEEGNCTVYRFAIDRCTYRNGILSDNPYHPDMPAWFARPETEKEKRPYDMTYLSRVASSSDTPYETLVAMLCSEEIIHRANAYMAIGDYHGWYELDPYPLVLTEEEVKERYSSEKYQRKIK